MRTLVLGALAMVLIACREDPSITPIVDAVDPGQAPVVESTPQVPSTPASRETRMPTKLRNRIQNEMRTARHARVRVRQALYLRAPDGAGTVFALTEHSEYEACINTPLTAGRPLTRAQRAARCRNEIISGNGSCTVQSVVRIDVAPPTDTLRIGPTHRVRLGCTVRRVRAFRFRDADGDGQSELELDVIGVTHGTGDRGGTPYTIRSRTLAIYRDDLSAQFEERLTDAGCDCEETGETLTARRVRFEDANSDGHPDALFDRVTYETLGDCDEDEMGWPRLAADPNASECAGDVEQLQWIYDPASDSWPDPSRPPRRAQNAPAAAMPPP